MTPLVAFIHTVFTDPPVLITRRFFREFSDIPIDQFCRRFDLSCTLHHQDKSHEYLVFAPKSDTHTPCDNSEL